MRAGKPPVRPESLKTQKERTAAPLSCCRAHQVHADTALTGATVSLIKRKGIGIMAARPTSKPIEVLPMLKTVEQMSRISGIGENKLRELMDNHEIEFVQNGNRRLLADAAIWDWYERNKVCAGKEG